MTVDVKQYCKNSRMTWDIWIIRTPWLLQVLVSCVMCSTISINYKKDILQQNNENQDKKDYQFRRRSWL